MYDGGQVALDLLEKSLAARYHRGRKPPSKYVDATLPTQSLFLGWNQRSGLDRSVQEFRQNGESGRRGLKTLAPFAEDPHDFKSMLLRDVLIRAGHDAAENIIQWRLRGIVGVNTKIGEGETSLPVLGGL